MCTQTVLITGITGFLGSNLARALIQNGYSVLGLKREGSKTTRIEDLAGKISTIDYGYDNLTAMLNQNNVNTVIHTACDYGRNKAEISSVFRANVIFSLEIYEAAVASGIKSFINVGTLLPNNVSNYAISKHQFIQILKANQNADIKCINMLIEHMYGAGDDSNKLVYWLIEQLRQSAITSVPLTPGRQTRDFIYIDDIVNAFLIVLQNIDSIPAMHDIQIGTGTSIELKKFIVKLKEQYEKKYGPSFTTFEFGKLPYRKAEKMNVTVDNNFLLELGWTPTIDVDTGISKILQDLK